MLYRLHGRMTKVVFIQGIHNAENHNKLFLEQFRDAGMEVIHFPLFYTLKEYDRQLELIQKINEYMEETDGRFIIIGHSFGGILSYCLREDLYQKVDKIITVASPHQVEFKWFKKILSRLPYRREVGVPDQQSYGFVFDTTVPFIFTRYTSAQKHQNLIGTHNRILNSQKLVRNWIQALEREPAQRYE